MIYVYYEILFEPFECFYKTWSDSTCTIEGSVQFGLKVHAVRNITIIN